MFAVKRSIILMIVDDSWQNHAIKSHECKQVWTALRSTISVVFEFKSRSYELKIEKPTEKNVPKYPPPPLPVFESHYSFVQNKLSFIIIHLKLKNMSISINQNHRPQKITDSLRLLINSFAIENDMEICLRS